jgi:pyruvate/2-oxoglutarate dehydrogenase complex dihydrolipoamide acyltransferase (E2) component
MPKKPTGYEIAPFPRLRQLIVDAGRVAVRKHTIRCLLEADVTRVRQFIREHEAQTGESLSFTAFVIACLGRAVEADKHVHAYRRRNQLIVFDDVDVATYVEVGAGDERFPLMHVLRAVNRRTWRELHDEIRAVQSRPEQAPNARRRAAVEWFLLLPRFVRDLFYRFVNGNPHVWKRQAGTVCVTAVGMFGAGSGWGIAYSAHTLGVIIGGIGAKPVAVAGRVEIRECLSLTVDFDHDIVDGAPAARFIERFKTLIEGEEGLACMNRTDNVGRASSGSL